VVVGVTVLVLVIAVIIRHGSGSSPHATPRPGPATPCHVSTALVTPMTVCAEGTPAPSTPAGNS